MEWKTSFLFSNHFVLENKTRKSKVLKLHRICGEPVSILKITECIKIRCHIKLWGSVSFRRRSSKLRYINRCLFIDILVSMVHVALCILLFVLLYIQRERRLRTFLFFLRIVVFFHGCNNNCIAFFWSSNEQACVVITFNH